MPKELKNKIYTNGWGEFSLSYLKEVLFPAKLVVCRKELLSSLSDAVGKMQWKMCVKQKSVIIYGSKS